MKQQWTLIFSLVFAIVIAIFSVVNVESVPVDFVFGEAQFPLIMVILGSALAGGLAASLFGTFRMVRMSRQIRGLQKELQAAKEEAADAKASPDPSEAPSASSAADPQEQAAGEDKQ
ncbi:LapA family protein [Paenibacillus thermotolerans]|uniref:LapA family protein n=1 Tax=Paenibacillus thermotolerans TaxID=3027807 RepID=UPI0023675EA9|nr:MULTISPECIES: lipopolysaccharide assembly protein LapA domain-containing protein [unclassified Paenibacillus]